MNPIYLRLFDGYAADILQKADSFRTPFWPATSSGPPTPSPWDSTWAYPWSTTMSAVEAPSRSSSARGASSTWAPIFPAEI